ncbi:uncharacterized protein LOC101236857 isoform X1 [Hydra vulgaris]|uniref:uncharacterized protein LOC101236857 isoform X1 n=3 Tax=Hydra vulgaris TaxID=6087 RepID=UPI0032E9FE32
MEFMQGIEMYNDLIQHTIVLETDSLLDGGIFTGEMIEVFGPPAVGKTQLALTLTAATIEKQHNVIYFDSTSSFSAERLLQILSLRSNLYSMQRNKLLLSNVRCFPVYLAVDFIDQLKKIGQALEQEWDSFFIKSKLIIVDSIASLITPILGGQQFKGHAIMSKIGLLLKKISHQFGIAVLVINNSVLNYKPDTVPCYGQYKPSLGQTWHCVPSIRLMLDFTNEKSTQRVCTIQKHTRLPGNLSTCVCIQMEGLCTSSVKMTTK